jgi:hypothetical protein
MDREYHVVLVIENGTTLQSSDLFIDSGDKAAALFTEKIKEIDPNVDQETLEAALDEGWYTSGNTVVMYTEPFNIFGKE